MNQTVTIIGGGLAGCEAAYQIAKKGYKVKLYEMKPTKFSNAHSNKNLAEIVCSNSFKSNLHTNACGLLKEELRILDSLLIQCADKTSVPAGQALAVDRDKFSELVTKEIKQNPNIEIINREYMGNELISRGTVCGNTSLDMTPLCPKTLEAKLNTNSYNTNITIIATGPLTSDAFAKNIQKITGEEDLYFYDAAAPIVTKESIDMNIAFYGDRYEQERGKEEDIDSWKKRISNIEASYINLPMNKEEYEEFVKELVNAEIVTLHEFEKREIFEGCMPIEIMAKRGGDTLRFGPLKPVGFTDLRTGFRPYAIVKLRQDDVNGTIYNLVGFQTNLKFGEQKRVFSNIPGLKNAEFVKYGVMHRNTYINGGKLLDNTYCLKKNPNIYFAGQITGVEGYVESISSGMVVGLNVVNRLQGKERIQFPKTTMIGALANYISTENEKFQPMNANFGILPELAEKIRDKKLKYTYLADRAIEEIKKLCKL